VRRIDAPQTSGGYFRAAGARSYFRRMDDFFLHSLVTPVLVALATTLVVEYAAKPRLEARKARILRSRAEVDEFVYAAQRLGLLAGALPDSRQIRAHPGLEDYAREAIAELDAAAGEAVRVLSRLSARYAVAHGLHVAKTASFLGYLRGSCHGAAARPADHVDRLKDLVGDLENFDVYFRVHLGLGDSQEPLVKRLFWRAATQRDYAKQADATLARHGLSAASASD
jgi:hypothetical protein